MYKALATALFIASTVAGPVFAKGTLYECDITENVKNASWISEKMAIVVTDSGEVMVSDAVILNFFGKPIPARARTNNDRRMVLRWTLMDAIAAGGMKIDQFDYVARLNKKTNKISVNAYPIGFDNYFFGRGTCVSRQE